MGKSQATQTSQKKFKTCRLKNFKPSAEKILSNFFLQEKFIDCGNLQKIFGVEVVNIEFELGEYKFEWDSEKAKINKQKHNVMFSIAAKVFLDDYKIDEFDELHSDFEERHKIIGRVGKILAVIYTERGENYRIISARRATKSEEERYYDQFRDF